MKKVITAAIAGVLALTAAGCTSDRTDASVVSENLSVAADMFEVQRVIKGVNAITDTPAFEVEGRCSLQRGGDLVVTCKHGPDDYRKHYLGLADNVYWVAVQSGPIDVSEYRTRIVVKPETMIPDFDLETSGDLEGDGDGENVSSNN